ncbi:hypothetical protein D9M68_692680 [compost metagenome]
MPGDTWPWMYSRSPPWFSLSACQKWLKPAPNMLASEAKEPMWPPRSPPSGGWMRLALTTMAMAFQRM